MNGRARRKQRSESMVMAKLGAAATVGVLLVSSACGGSGEGGASATTAADSTSGNAATPTTTADNEVDNESSTVSANNATISELSAAFESAGIPNAERWAREVDEYRPYSEADASFAKLRQELAKYNPSDEVVEQIGATLTLP